MTEPTPLAFHLVLVGGDPCVSHTTEAWRACWMIVLDRLSNHTPPGSLVIFGPVKGSPDVLASYGARLLGHLALCYGEDGWIRHHPSDITTLGRKRNLDNDDPETPGTFATVGRWSAHPDGFGLQHKLAQRAWLAAMSGWEVDILVFHGWEGQFQGERLVEALDHLGMKARQWDVAGDGRTMLRDEPGTFVPEDAPAEQETAA